MTRVYTYSRIAMVTVLLGCSGGERSIVSPRTIRIKGSDTMALLTQRWASAYMQARPGIAVYTEGAGTVTGIQALINGTTELCAASRPLRSEEIQQLVHRWGSLGFSVLCARDALSIYLHPDNPVRSLTLEQVRGIFTGTIVNWKEVGGADQPIVPLSREPNSGTYLFFQDHVLLSLPYGGNVQPMPGTAAIARAVAGNPFAVGYGGFAYGVGVYDCMIEGVEPSPANVRNGTYPISRYLYLYTVEPPKGQIKHFVDWVLGKEGQEVVREIGYIPLFTVE